MKTLFNHTDKQRDILIFSLNMFSQLLTTVIIFCLYQTYKGCLTMFDYGESTTGLGEVSIMIIVYMSIPFC